jgi:hemolysin activation/secretion protein
VFVTSDFFASAQADAHLPVATAAPIVPTYRVQRFEIVGSSVLDQATVDRLTAGSTGDAVSLAHLRRGLVKIQQSYRERGYPQAAVTLPRQPLTNGIVKVRVADGGDQRSSAAAADPTLAAWSVPTFDIQQFEVRGNSVLTAAEAEQILTPAAGLAVNRDQLQKTLDQLQTAYRERGYPDATVSLPQQLLFPDGKVTIAVNEGLSTKQIAERLAQASAVETAELPKPPERTFEVRRYDVQGNTLLKPQLVASLFTNFVGPNISLKQIQQALGGLQLAYRERGYVSVAVGLPQQQLTNAEVKVRVTEGVISRINVTGNRHFSSNNIVRLLPSLHPNQVLNGLILQRELDQANQNRDRQIYPVIGPGPDPGTSEITLKVKDRFPAHGRLEVNNYSTPGSPDWRVNGSGQFNNLWQLEHSFGLTYGYSPEAYKADGLVPDYLLNRPLVANGGVYYRLPFGGPASVAEQITTYKRFGYDEATRQFILPPAGLRPDFTLFASSSSADTGLKFGEAKIVAQTPLLTIISQDSGEDVTVNHGVGGRFNFPLVLSDKKRFSFSAGADWKNFSQQSFNANNFFITTIVTNASGSQTISSQVASQQPARRSTIHYLPLTLGVDYFQTDAHGTLSASLAVNYNLIGHDRTAYDPVGTNSLSSAYSPTTRGVRYGKAVFSVVRDQKVFKNWSFLARLNAQAATTGLIGNEQFALGGLNSVRGYFEGDEYGDAGWFGSAELRTPYINTQVPVWSGSLPVWLRGSVFVDGAQRFAYNFKNSGDLYPSLLGVGFGLSANINNRLDARLTVGWPLLDTPNTSAYEPHAYVSLGGQF